MSNKKAKNKTKKHINMSSTFSPSIPSLAPFLIIFVKHKFDYVTFLLKIQDTCSVPTFYGKPWNMATVAFIPLTLSLLSWPLPSYTPHLIDNRHFSCSVHILYTSMPLERGPTCNVFGSYLPSSLLIIHLGLVQKCNFPAHSPTLAGLQKEYLLCAAILHTLEITLRLS